MIYAKNTAPTKSIGTRNSTRKTKIPYFTLTSDLYFYVLLTASAQITFATILFTLGLYNMINGFDELLLFFAAPFELISAMLGLLTVHMGKSLVKLWVSG